MLYESDRDPKNMNLTITKTLGMHLLFAVIELQSQWQFP